MTDVASELRGAEGGEERPGDLQVEGVDVEVEEGEAVRHPLAAEQIGRVRGEDAPPAEAYSREGGVGVGAEGEAGRIALDGQAAPPAVAEERKGARSIDAVARGQVHREAALRQTQAVEECFEVRPLPRVGGVATRARRDDGVNP